MVTYTEVSSLFKDLSDIGSLGFDRLPMMSEDPYAYVEAALQTSPSPDYMPSHEHSPSPDYVLGPEHPPSPAYVPKFVLEPVYLEFMPPEDDVLSAKEQPLPVAVSPTADSPGYINKFDPKGDPVEDDEDPKDDPADYPTEKEDDDKEEPSERRNDRAKWDHDEDEEVEEHSVLADSIPPPPVHCTITMISIPTQAPVPFLSEAEVERLLALPTLPPSPLTPYSTPLLHIPSPPLPASPTYPLGYKAAMILLRAESPSTSIYHHLLFEVRESSSVLIGGFRVDYGFVGTLDDEIRRDLDREIGCRIIDVWEDPNEIAKEILMTDMAELGQRMIDFMTTVMHDTDEIYGRLDDAQDGRLYMVDQLNMLCRDRRSHARTARLIESEARLSREAWVQSMDASDMAHAKIMSLRTTVLAQQTKITGLRAAKMAPKRTTRSTPATTTTTTTTPTNLKKKMTDKYCPMCEIKKLEVELWNLKVKGTDVVSYNQRFKESTLMCARMFLEESDKIERYISGLPDMIYGSVMASKPKTMQDFPLNYESEPGYIENYNSYPYDSSSFPQQYLCCETCEGPHETFQCQPMSQNFYEPNICYNSNSFNVDQFLPPQCPVIHQPPQEISIQEMKDLKQYYIDEMKRLINSEYRDEIKIDELKGNFNRMSIEINKKEKLQQLEQVANLSTYPSKSFNSFCYDDDDDEGYTIVSTSDFLITDSLIMENEHIDTIPKTKSDEFIKFSVENLVPIPSKSEDFSDIESECDMPDCDDSQTIKFSTFSNPLFDDSTCSDDESSHEEVIHKMSFKTYSNPLFDLDEEIVSSEFNPIHNEDLNSTSKNDRFDTKSYLLESLLNRDESIPSGIDSGDSDSEGDNISLERLLHDDPIPLLVILDFLNVVRIFLPFFTYPVTSSNLLSLGNEDTIFDPGICSYHISSFLSDVSHRSETFMKFIVYLNYLNESPMKILSSTCSSMDQ
nr:reverse transcriptase domain-containing protein [Tanacetum cinerariifolium]